MLREPVTDDARYTYECGCDMVEDKERSAVDWIAFIPRCEEHGKPIDAVVLARLALPRKG